MTWRVFVSSILGVELVLALCYVLWALSLESLLMPDSERAGSSSVGWRCKRRFAAEHDSECT